MPSNAGGKRFRGKPPMRGVKREYSPEVDGVNTKVLPGMKIVLDCPSNKAGAAVAALPATPPAPAGGGLLGSGAALARALRRA